MLKLIEKWYVVAALIFFAGAVLSSNERAVAGPSEGGFLTWVAVALVDAILVFFLVLRWRCVSPALRQSTFVLLLTGLALSSVAWSSYKELTLRRSVVLALTSLFGIYFGARFTRRQKIKLLSIALVLAAALSLAVAVLMPSIGVMHGIHEGEWCGIFAHKNSLGRVMALAGIVFALRIATERRHVRLFYSAAFVLAIALILLSGSKTAAIVLAFSLSLLPFLRFLYWHPKISIPVFAMLMIAAILASQVNLSLPGVLNSLGRDTTLTGRTVIWAAVALAISRQPLLGYGFNTFWLGVEGDSQAVLSSSRWLVPNAHNGFLDLCIDLGLIGMIVFLVGFITLVVKLVREIRDHSSAIDYLPIAFLTILVAYNFSESTLLRQNELFWVIYVSLFVSRVPSASNNQLFEAPTTV